MLRRLIDYIIKPKYKIKVMLDEGAYMPTRAHEWDAGWDLRTPETIYIANDGWAEVDTGVHVQIPHGHVGLIMSKSGLNMKNGITTEGVVDSEYTGSIRVKLYAKHHFGTTIEKGQKITQLVIMPITRVDDMVVVKSFKRTERGNNGFGSTGK